MILKIEGKPTEVEYIRVFRDARNVAFYALVGDEWFYFHKFRDKRIPTYDKLDWPNPDHKYGWSNPYQVRG